MTRRTKERISAFTGVETDGAGEARNRLTSGLDGAQNLSAVGPSQATSEPSTEKSGRGRPRNPETIQSGGNKGLRAGDARVTIVESEDMLMWYRDYAYTTGMTRREAIHNALQMYRDHIESTGQAVRQNPRFAR